QNSAKSAWIVAPRWIREGRWFLADARRLLQDFRSRSTTEGRVMKKELVLAYRGGAVLPVKRQPIHAFHIRCDQANCHRLRFRPRPCERKAVRFAVSHIAL